MKPPRLVYSNHMPLAVAVEEAGIEAEVRRHEAHRHVAGLRLLARQMPLWTPEQFQRALLREAESYERKWADEPEQAA